MKVPDKIRRLFDEFPVTTLPAYLDPEEEDSVLYVYNIEKETGLPLDPRCLMMYGFLKHAKVEFRTEVAPPQLSTELCLPLFCSPKVRTAKLEALIPIYLPGKSGDALLSVYKSLLSTWINDAWHYTKTKHSKILDKYYSDQSMEKSPSIVANVFKRDLYKTLNSRYERSRKHNGDEFVYYTPSSGINRTRVLLAFKALDDELKKYEEIQILHIAVFGFVYPILKLFPKSDLATAIPEGLVDLNEKILLYVK